MTANREDHPMSTLLADPAQIALIRDLYAHARKVRAEHVTYSIAYSIGTVADRAYGPKEHTWTAGASRVSIEGRWLTYRRHGVQLLCATVVDARQVGQLLAAVGVLPERFTGGAR